MLDEADPYVAYCIDDACELAAYLAEQKTQQNGKMPEARPPPPRIQRLAGHGPLIVGTISRDD